MKKFLIAVAAALALSLISSCNLDIDQAYIGLEYIIFPPQGDSINNIPLYATGDWTATINAPEIMDISVSPMSGNGNTSLTITLGPYECEDDLTLGYVVVECGSSKTSFPVYQCSEEYWKEMEARDSGN